MVWIALFWALITLLAVGGIFALVWWACTPSESRLRLSPDVKPPPKRRKRRRQKREDEVLAGVHANNSILLVCLLIWWWSRTAPDVVHTFWVDFIVYPLGG